MAKHQPIDVGGPNIVIKQFLRDRKAGSEAIGFLATILLLMLVILNLGQPVKLVLQKLVIENIHRVTLMEMEQEGGFTTTIRDTALDRLEAFGFDPSRLEVESSTPRPIQWGNDISLTIQYTNEYTTYTFQDFSITSTQEDEVVEVTRSSVSREYFK